MTQLSFNGADIDLYRKGVSEDMKSVIHLTTFDPFVIVEDIRSLTIINLRHLKRQCCWRILDF